ncbi:uncharacterized protein LOC131161621 [Malania oleifera]|uniref:uncharacterized protein LOC131161621 n=1 Tax=Malania oleifera TaxID=397392 RepID=UPI0025AE02A7|nr:uncharacterized protein LOC131161621 [Malania oleifera]
MCSALELAHGFRAQTQKKIKQSLHGGAMGLNSDAHLLIIRLPDSRVLRVIARSVLLALVILSFPWFGSIIGEFLNPHQVVSATDVSPDSINLDQLPILFHDLTKERLLKLGDRVLFVSNGKNEDEIYNSQVLSGNEMDLISDSDSERQSSIPDGVFDFAFANGFHAAGEFIDRTLKVGGIAAVLLTGDDSLDVRFNAPANYKIIYLRRFKSTVVAMRKTHSADPTGSTRQRRRLLGFASEDKKAALKKLEDVLLEPPRAASGKSSRYMKRTRYLPDLMGDSLESYSRRVFIDVGGGSGGDAEAWFASNYPTRNREFELYKIETVAEELAAAEGKGVGAIGMSEWLRRNVRVEEYVVMKAEAEVVEEMVKSGAIGLVDEMFMECKPQGLGRKGHRSRRAYWECLSLYGRLRDEGVAVHQWWG